MQQGIFRTEQGSSFWWGARRETSVFFGVDEVLGRHKGSEKRQPPPSVVRKNSTTFMQREPKGCTRGEARTGRRWRSRATLRSTFRQLFRERGRSPANLRLPTGRLRTDDALVQQKSMCFQDGRDAESAGKSRPSNRVEK